MFYYLYALFVGLAVQGIRGERRGIKGEADLVMNQHTRHLALQFVTYIIKSI